MSAATVNTAVSALLATLAAATEEAAADLARRVDVGERLTALIESANVERVAAIAAAHPSDVQVRRQLARRLAELRWPKAVSVADAIAESERDEELATLNP